MPTKASLWIYGAILLTVLVGDGLWLGVIARDWYLSGIGHLMAASPNWYAAVLFYLGYALGIYYFAVAPNIGRATLRSVMVTGALLGLFAYGTYDLTSQAIMHNWPLAITVLDMTWGALLTALAAGAGFRMSTRIT